MTDALGTCKHCGAPIRWIKTRRGRWMPLQADPKQFEPHFPHCGRNLWTEQQWHDFYMECRAKEARENANPALTVFGKVVRGKEARRLLARWAKEKDDTPGLPWD